MTSPTNGYLPTYLLQEMRHDISATRESVTVLRAEMAPLHSMAATFDRLRARVRNVLTALLIIGMVLSWLPGLRTALVRGVLQEATAFWNNTMSAD